MRAGPTHLWCPIRDPPVGERDGRWCLPQKVIMTAAKLATTEEAPIIVEEVGQ